MNDFALTLNDFSMPEITFGPADLVLNAVLLSLHIKRGSFFANPDFGNRLHEIKSTSPQDVALAKQYAQHALKWIVDAKLARSISVSSVTAARGGRLEFLIVVDDSTYNIQWSSAPTAPPVVITPPAPDPVPKDDDPIIDEPKDDECKCPCENCGDPVIPPPPQIIEVCRDCRKPIDDCICEDVPVIEPEIDPEIFANPAIDTLRPAVFMRGVKVVFCDECGETISECECVPDPTRWPTMLRGGKVVFDRIANSEIEDDVLRPAVFMRGNKVVFDRIADVERDDDLLKPAVFIRGGKEEIT